MSKTYEIRDPIHRKILIDEDERMVVDHPWVQRLRNIRQLGFVSLVYPGAVHDRFQHSLGVMHLAGEMLLQLLDERDVLRDLYMAEDLSYAYHLVRLAGLLHDVGHAPYSHTCERFLPDVSVLRLPDDWYRRGMIPSERRATHEDVTLAVIHAFSKDGTLEEGVARDIAAVLSINVRRSPRLAALGPLVGILRSLISGELDADRCDYLLRDSHFTGVSYGVYDLPRLISCLCVLGQEHELQLGLDIHGVHALEGLLLARYHMFTQVYFHKSPPAFEYYLEQAIAKGEITYDTKSGLESIMELRDDVLVGRLYDACNQKKTWSSKIINREPAKLVLQERGGAEQQENFIKAELVGALKEAGCHVFSRRSHQQFCSIAGAGDISGGKHLACERRVLDQPIVESVAEHSDLLARFNQPIDTHYTYVLREDFETAHAVMKRMQVW